MTRTRLTRPVLLILLALTATASATTPPERWMAVSPENLSLASVAAVAVDLESGETLHDKRGDWTRPIASLTKLMTALVILDAGQDLDERLSIVERDHTINKNAYSRIRIGSTLSRGALMRIMLMSSENLAAHVLSVHFPGGRDAFIDAMNARAESLGMASTRFTDASGLSEGNISSARDLARLVATAYRHPEIREYSTTGSFTASFYGPRYSLGYGNTNPLVSNRSWGVGLSKTGYLVEAGRCLAMVATIEGRPVAMVLLDSFGNRTPLGDAGRIRRWLTTGDGGRVADAARRYEQQRVMDAESPQASR